MSIDLRHFKDIFVLSATKLKRCDKKITTTKCLNIKFVVKWLFEFILNGTLVVNFDIVREARGPPLHKYYVNL